jgi:DNA-binding NarL/FixJ family response regulator
MHVNVSAGQGCKTILLVDEHPLVRRGMRCLIEDGAEFEIVGEADCRSDAVKCAIATEPDIVVVDPSMPKIGGVETMIELRGHLPNVEFVVFTMQGIEPILAKATRAGARAGVCKSDCDHLVPALRAVARHKGYFSPNVAESLGHPRSKWSLG